MADKFGDGSPQFEIKDGWMQEGSLDFQRFKRLNVNEWGPISVIISEFEKMI